MMRVLLDVRPTYQRLVAVATVVFLVTACGDKGLDKPLPKASQRITVQLPWPDGGRIPRRDTCDGADAKPSIRASGTRSLRASAFVMTDPDAPGGTFVHWTRWGAVEGRNSFGKVGYSGPCPPRGDHPHHYVVTVYALRRRLALAAGASPGDVIAAIRKLAVASGSATGLYGR
jgi:phosphatidylethanolamine-binding protein (PEBP) family uncharacterized protein